MAGLIAALLLATSGRYGYFGDELYFLAAGRHLDWGYADQPPLLPLLALLMDTIAPGSVVVLRLPAILATAAAVVLTALIAREFGGGRRAQLLAAGAVAVSSGFLGTGHYLATSTMDPFLWTLLLWLLVRWVRTRADGLLLWAGLVTGVALNVKLLAGGFWVVAGICLLAVGPKDLLRRPALWGGAAIAAVLVAPTLVWQTVNGWPQLEMSAAIASEVSGAWGGRALFVPAVLVAGAGLIVGAVLLCYGLWQLLRSPALRPWRFLGWTTVGLLLVFIAVSGRYYYLAGMFGVCWAAAAVRIEAGQPKRWWRWVATWPVYALSLVITVPVTLPVLPESWIGREIPQPAFAGGEIGWPELTDSIAAQYHRLPPEQRARTAVVTGMYWMASAVEHYGPERGVPAAYSGSRGFWTLHTPPETADTVLYAGDDPAALHGSFRQVRQVGVVETGHTGTLIPSGTPILLATGRTAPWSVLWPRFRNMEW
ncbi:glycosyl transferase, family 39 [Amycolatopsis suaedae]|uniref:Glycosyl transferase, family 39 n=1 Tax=Amycolatopsis suaedae TaxID=2510978 RepID=A0A4Q7J7T6_9PSEU|nr:glycosyl transferase, family 39 [Amycolatopsis suaedae]